MADRLEKLRELEAHLYMALQTSDIKSMAAIARQYRETIREIEEIEGKGDTDDEIGAIIAGRAADGKPGAVRKTRT